MNSGCTWTIVWTWKKRSVDVMTQWCWSDRTLSEQRNCRNRSSGSTKRSSWIQHSDGYGCNQGPGWHFLLQNQERCTSSESKLLHVQQLHSIEEVDFHAEFDHLWKEWTALWKWTEDKVPNKLQNHIMEYAMLTEIWSSYKRIAAMD